MPDPSIFTAVIDSYLPEPHASLLNGIIFGTNLKAGYDFYERVKIVGLLHIVVLSGINITLLTVIISNFTRFLGKQLSLLITILSIVFFIIFVGAKAPIIRAGFMGILTLVAILTGRKNIPLYSLFLSLILIALFWPRWLKTISLQLSYGATLGIILFGQVKTKTPKNLWEKIIFQLEKEFKPSLAAQIFTAPLIFLSFKQISLISPLTNFLTAPMIPPLMVFGFLTAILGKINYFLGLPFSYLCFAILEYLIFLINFFAKIPYGFIQL